MEIHPGLSRWLKFNPKDPCRREAGESESERLKNDVLLQMEEGATSQEMWAPLEAGKCKKWALPTEQPEAKPTVSCFVFSLSVNVDKTQDN